MNNQNRNLFLPLTALILIFILQAFFYDDNVHTAPDHVLWQDTFFTELVYQPDKPDIPRITDCSSIITPYKDLSDCFRNYLPDSVFFTYPPVCLYSKDILSRHLDFPVNNRISILQKKNLWHQSSGEMPYTRILS